MQEPFMVQSENAARKICLWNFLLKEIAIWTNGCGQGEDDNDDDDYRDGVPNTVWT